ncbi:hypothetical protein KBC75_02280 [Candidatus Shapirobacteria bacterium]|nr:hypothetical protein [Candidatus Shapirobacteria bacterium]
MNYLIIGFGQTILFLFLMRIDFLYQEGPLFFRGVVLLTLSAIAVMWLLIKYLKPWQRVAEISLVVWSLNLVFLVLFPVTFERSVTMYLLNKINSSERITKTELREDLEKTYIEKNDAVQKRLNEQKTTGFVKIDGDRIELSKKGELFLKLSAFLAKVYGIKN